MTADVAMDAFGGNVASSNEGTDRSRAVKANRFTQEELDSMLYEWDEGVYPVQEYHVASSDMVAPDAETDAGKNKGSDGDEKESKEDDEDHHKVYLDIDTEDEAYVIEFYQPWCPHCQHYKPQYIELARTLQRRSVGTKVNFLAVSCELYLNLCHTLDVHSYPTILGYAVGSDPFKRGIELNGEDVPDLSPESIRDLLSVEIANEKVDEWESEYSNSEDLRAREQEKVEAAKESARIKKEWQSFPSTLNDRYQNAGLSFAFALKTGVYDRFGKLREDRALALADFLDLLDWTLPQSWRVRTGLVKELRFRYHDVVVSGRSSLVDLVEYNQMLHEEKGGASAMDDLWGHIDVPRRKQRRNKVTGLGGDVPEPKRKDVILSRNRKWTDGCTHSRAAMGFSCGLWNLFHIITIGASLEEHQLYGFHAGYLTSHQNVALIIRNFVANFFACDVCSWHFTDLYDQCGHNHCNRLPDESLLILGKSGKTERVQQLSMELSLWLFEVHNAVNLRLMDEAAARDHRDVTIEELRAAVFPTEEMCPHCWTNVTKNEYSPEEVYKFLQQWYWPKEEVVDPGFSEVLNRNLVAKGMKIAPTQITTFSSFFLTMSITIAIFVLIIKFINQGSPGSSRDQLHYSQTRRMQKRRIKR